MNAGIALLASVIAGDIRLGSALAKSASKGFGVPLLPENTTPVDFRYVSRDEFDEVAQRMEAVYFYPKQLAVNFRCDGRDYGIRLSTIKARRLQNPHW